MIKRPKQLVIALLVSFAAGAIGSLATTPAIPTWYAALQKPFFNPPNWVFAPVWTVLYVLMGIALYLIWQQKRSAARQQATALFYVQLALNALWSLVFFGLHQLGWALVIIIVLIAVLIELIRQTAFLDRRVSWLLAPYLAWVMFATLLNAAVWQLN